MRWQIVDGPNPLKDAHGTDGVLFGFVIENTNDKAIRRPVVVVVSRSALAADQNGLRGDIREAIDTAGRTAIERYLEKEDPPARILVSSTSIGPSGT